MNHPIIARGEQPRNVQWTFSVATNEMSLTLVYSYACQPRHLARVYSKSSLSSSALSRFLTGAAR
jgi:hypothetical protein